MTEIKAGIYRHYKGPLYLVLGLAHDANADTLASSESHEFEVNPGDWPGVRTGRRHSEAAKIKQKSKPRIQCGCGMVIAAHHYQRHLDGGAHRARST